MGDTAVLSVGPITIIIRALTVLCWALVVLATLPFGTFLSEAVVRLLMTAALAGTCHYLATRINKPAIEVYEAGKAMGRAELLREQACTDVVVNLADRRQMRATEDGERAIGGGRWFS